MPKKLLLSLFSSKQPVYIVPCRGGQRRYTTATFQLGVLNLQRRLRQYRVAIILNASNTVFKGRDEMKQRDLLGESVTPARSGVWSLIHLPRRSNLQAHRFSVAGKDTQINARPHLNKSLYPCDSGALRFCAQTEGGQKHEYLKWCTGVRGVHTKFLCHPSS